MESKFKLNEKAKVINNTCCHKFMVGDVVTIIQIVPSTYCESGYYYIAKNSSGDMWSLDFYDLEKIDFITNFEKFKLLSVEQLAQINVKSHMYNAGYLVMCDFITTDGNLFSDKWEAIEYEKEWLRSKVNEEDGIFNFDY